MFPVAVACTWLYHIKPAAGVSSTRFVKGVGPGCPAGIAAIAVGEYEYDLPSPTHCWCPQKHLDLNRHHHKQIGRCWGNNPMTMRRAIRMVVELKTLPLIIAEMVVAGWQYQSHRPAPGGTKYPS